MGSPADNAKPAGKVATGPSSTHSESMSKQLQSITEFCEHSSIPGFRRIGTFRTNCVKWIWFAVICGSFIGLILHLIVNTARFARQDIVTQTILNEVPFVFPDITICNNFPFSFDRIHRRKVTVGNETMRGKEFLCKVKRFWQAALNLSRSDKKCTEARDDNHVSRRTMARYATSHDFGHHVDDVILSCTFMGRECSLSNFSTHQYPFYQNCFTFSPKYNETDDTTDANGLFLILYLGDRRAMLTDNEFLYWLRGAVIIIHRRHTFPTIKGIKTIAKVGEQILIGLEMTRNVRLNRAGHRCSDAGHRQYITTSLPDWTGRRSSIKTTPYCPELCKDLEKQRRFKQQCGCLSEDFSIQGTENKSGESGVFCHQLDDSYFSGVNYKWINDSIYVKESGLQEVPFEEWRRSDVEKVLQRHKCHDMINNGRFTKLNHTKDQTSCLPLCNSVSYKVNVMSYPWPDAASHAGPALKKLINARVGNGSGSSASRKALKKLNKRSSIRTRFSQVTIYAESNTGTVIKEQLDYPSSGYFSDIGGVVGLWVGMSVITLIEILSGFLILFERRRNQLRRVFTSQGLVARNVDVTNAGITEDHAVKAAVMKN